MGGSDSKQEKLGFGVKAAYGAGDIFGGGALIIIGIFYLYFLTDVIKINPALAGVTILLSKGWDAISDPLMGIISDRTRSRFGRRRPYFLFGIPLVFLASFLLWFPIDFDLEIHRFIFVTISYLFFSTILTMTMVPLTALASELTLDYKERTSLVSVRMWFSGFAALICAAVPMEIVKSYADVRQGYIAMALFLGIFFAVPWIFTFLFTWEREEFQTTVEPMDFRKTMKTFFDPFRIRSFRNVVMLYVFSFITMDILMAIVIYFMTYYLKKSDQTNYVLATLFIVKLVFIPVLYILSQRINKKTGFVFFCGLLLGTMLFSFIFTPDTPVILLHVFAALLGINFGGIGVLAYAIFPDVPDVDELYSGQRREGIYSGLFTFARKLGSALVLFLLSTTLSLSGYKAPVKETIGGITRLIQQEQSSAFILTLRIIFVAGPLLFLFIAFLNVLKYPLTPQVHERLREFLKLKRTGMGEPASMETEEKELSRLLI